MKILLIEDDPILRRTMGHLISRWYPESTIDMAEDGQIGLGKVIESTFELILLDQQLPDLKGHIVAQKIREMDLDYRPFILALTAYVDDEARQRFLDAGMDAVIEKPIRETVLKETMLKLQEC